jgi:hypothetical protein
MDDKFYELAQRFIVEDIVVQRPDVVIMPCFEQSLTAEQYNKFGLTRNEHFYWLNELQCRSFGMPVEQCIRYRENTEIMNGHLTPEFNEIVGNLVYNRIVNNKWTRFPTETIKHKFTMKEYYKNLDDEENTIDEKEYAQAIVTIEKYKNQHGTNAGDAEPNKHAFGTTDVK